MTIAHVQDAPIANGTAATSTTFSAATTAGNAVVLTATAYNTGGALITSDTPVFGGSAFPSAVQILQQQSTRAGGNTVYFTKWLFPNVPAGTTVGVTLHNGTIDGNVGATAQEFSGLGSGPSVDQSSTGASVAAGSAGPADSGTTPAITAAPELVLGSAIGFGQAATGPGAPWTNERTNSTFAVDGYQIVTSAGGTYDFSATLAAVCQWSAGVVTVQGTPASTASAAAAFGDTDVSWEKLQLLGVVR